MIGKPASAKVLSTHQSRVPDVREATLAMLAGREAAKTVCPSEVARSISDGAAADDDWRTMMPIVHEAIDALLAAGLVQISWKGKPLKTRDGPYRIGRPS